MKASHWLLPLSKPAAAVPFVLGSTSIATLLAYFYGVASMAAGVRWLLLPSIGLLAVFWWWARRRDEGLADRVVAGIWAGALATLFYDLVRVPISLAGVPVFKAISYFGTVILDRTVPDAVSDLAGWSYHLSNGIGFGVMYAVLVSRFQLWSALVWGVTLEVAMLYTPYAEVFGYRVSPKFLAITIGAHLVYGAVLWAALEYWRRGGHRPAKLVALGLLAPLGIGGVAAEFHARHVASIPPSPPTYVGEHLYTTWNVLEPDRLSVLWMMKRFVDPRARFDYVEPFSHIRFGRPLDTPEADTRRSGTRSATELLVDEQGLGDDPKLAALASMTHLFEITRWQLPSRPESYRLGEELMAAAGECGDRKDPCVARAMAYLDAWYSDDGAP